MLILARWRFRCCGYPVRQFHQLDSSNNEFCGLRLMVRVDVLGSVNPNPNLNPNPNQKLLA